ncbi:hypothetical protein ACFYKX_19095 [Cytobacillus sp. FJAT-54145]|uniref:Uncharacterized protein n=1 Tax=Cytobacillus spartinae TaxID=3299023 RepID=A0ABW6KGK3_9BACI
MKDNQIPFKESYESDGEMGNKKGSKERKSEEKDKNDFFNITPSSE